MKSLKKFTLITILFIGINSLSGCYVLEYNVGSGAQTGVETKQKNHYLIFGLAPLKTSDPNAMAGGASDYKVRIEHTFVDGLVNAITFGIYNPTTTYHKINEVFIDRNWRNINTLFLLSFI